MKSSDVNKLVKIAKQYKNSTVIFIALVIQFFYILNQVEFVTTVKSLFNVSQVVQPLSVVGVDVWCELVRVVDGDTIIVKYDGEDTRVRFIGVDTPESVHVDSSKNSDEGIVASDYMKTLLQDVKYVGLEFDEGQYDIYNRLLAYVYLENGTMLNAHLVETGYAEVKTYQPNTKYETYFKSLVK